MSKNKWVNIHIILELAVIAVIIVMLTHPVDGKDYRRYETDTLNYVRATVQDVISEELEESPLQTGQQLGVQTVLVELSDGSTIEIDNYLTETHNIFVKEGQKIIVCADVPENADPYYTVYNYDRIPGLVCLAVVFLGLMLAVGRRKGADAALAILFTLIMILRITLPAVYNGISPVGMGFLTVICATAVTLLLLQGITVQSGLGIGVTILGESAACILFAIFSGILHLTGFQTDDAEGLLLIAQNTGLNVRTLLFAGAMIASLGAVMDVAVSILSALREVASASKTTSRHELFQAGMNIGCDMIGTMSNTLIFAFAGSALTTMLVFYSYGVQFQQLLSSDYLTVELAQGLCSTAAVILTVPAAALVGAVAMADSRSDGRREKIDGVQKAVRRK